MDVTKSDAGSVIAITGANGFIGKQLVWELVKRTDVRIRTLVRDPKRIEFHHPNITEIYGALEAPESIEELLLPGCTVIHLAYGYNAPPEHNIKLTNVLVEKCRKQAIKLFVHCSTAAVYGRINGDILNEDVICYPRTSYGKTKLKIESIIRDGASGKYEYVILRPTAVFGPGGQSLSKHIHNLLYGSWITNYLRLCLFNRRHLNLVSVANMIAAIMFIIDSETGVDGETFIVSEDHEEGNNYLDVERYLRAGLLGDHRTFPHMELPLTFLKWMLIALGRDSVNPHFIYDSSKIRKVGFKQVETLQQGLDNVISWVRKRSEYRHRIR